MEIILQKALPHQQKAVDAVSGVFAGVTFLPPHQFYANPKVFFEIDCDWIPFEGELPCQYGLSYSSVMGKGVARIVEDVEEKKKAMSILMKTQTGKDFSFLDRLVSVVAVIRIDVAEYTAKHRPLPNKMR